MISGGSAVSSDPAIWIWYCASRLPASPCNATVMGCWSGSLAMVTPKRNSFQMLVNCQISTTTKAGTDSGKMMWR